jgi:preprotein translocase subunit SecA
MATLESALTISILIVFNRVSNIAKDSRLYISPAQAEEDWDVEGLHNVLKADYAADFSLQEWLDEAMATLESALTISILIVFNRVSNIAKDSRLYSCVGFFCEYDDVSNDQRKIIYKLRDELMDSNDVQGRFIAIQKTHAYILALDFSVHSLATSHFDANNPSLPNVLSEAVAMENTDSETPNDSQTYQRSGAKIGRNNPCPCGSLATLMVDSLSMRANRSDVILIQ